MNNKLEQIERLRERANVTYDEAKQAYEAADGDLLEALIILEKQGKVRPPEGDGFYSSERPQVEQPQEEKKKSKGEDFSSKLDRFWQFLVKLVNKGNNTIFEVSQNDVTVVKIPITIMVIFTLFLPWLVVSLLVLGLFFKFRYRVYENPENGN
ncbi:MAG TPA: DUF4342 domain-containing protein [Firmicutes bacterium]|nr:DUF4342 domain-containing protein [Bacillota bacterium]